MNVRRCGQRLPTPLAHTESAAVRSVEEIADGLWRTTNCVRMQQYFVPCVASPDGRNIAVTVSETGSISGQGRFFDYMLPPNLTHWFLCVTFELIPVCYITRMLGRPFGCGEVHCEKTWVIGEQCRHGLWMCAVCGRCETDEDLPSHQHARI